MISRTALFFCLLSVLVTSAQGQGTNLGNPPTLNFPPKMFRGGTQTWDIARSADGVMWFANNAGLLEYDGTHWRLYPLGNGTIARAVAAAPDGNVYVGGQGDFGYFAPDRQGVLQYHSLKILLPPAEQQLAEIWDVAVRPEGVFFRTDNQVFRYHDGQVTACFPPAQSLLFLGEWKGSLLVQDGDFRLHVFENDRFRPLGSPDRFTGGRISAMLPLGPDTMLITTIKDGIFYAAGQTLAPWPTPDDAFLRNNRIYCAGLLPDGSIALGTSLDGLATLDRQRRIFHHLDNKNGLRNNTVLSLLATPGGGVWLGLDNGIDFAEIHSPFSTFYPDGELRGTGYTAGIYRNRIYFGTNTGLYVADWKPYYTREERQQFRQVRNSGGQVWSLNRLGDALLAGHHEGAFQIDGDQARQLTRLNGIWKFVPLSADRAVAGHYNGLAAFERRGNSWEFGAPLTGFTESSRLLALDTARGVLWMAHPYRGIFRIRSDLETNTAAAEFFGAEHGLPSNLGNHLFQLGDNIVFTGAQGIFDFDEASGRFVPNDDFNRLLGKKTQVRYLRRDEAGNVWFATDREVGVLMVENDALDKKVRKMLVPELADKMNGGFPFILPVDRENVFVATGEGFIHFNPSAYRRADSTLHLVLHEFRLKGEADSLLFGGHFPPSGGLPDISLPARLNSVGFSFSTTGRPENDLIRYAYWLEGAEDGWSDWRAESSLGYNNLPPGRYVLHVKARNPHGVESNEWTFPFEILPPWYATRLAYAFYTILCLGLVAGFIYRQNRKFEREKQDLQSEHRHREDLLRQDARRSEETINRLQNEKLEAEISHKTQELASVTMHLVQKNEILLSIKDALEKLAHKVSATPELSREIARVVKLLEQDATIDADWQHFSNNFDQVHSDFLKRLGEHYPRLSPNDYKLCAYLRMNLSSKEIALLLNISIRGVEASRYRLRKRLGLGTEVNLTEYLMRF